MSLQTIDIVIVILYLIGVLIFGIWIGRREKANREGFFLGGRHFGWMLIGTSLFATNISSVQFVGQSGLAYKVGIAAANPQFNRRSLPGPISDFLHSYLFEDQDLYHTWFPGESVQQTSKVDLLRNDDPLRIVYDFDHSLYGKLGHTSALRV